MRKAVINVKCPYCGIEYTVERHLIKNDKGEWCLLPINEVEICKRCLRPFGLKEFLKGGKGG